MFVFPDLIVESVLSNGVAQLRDDPSIITNILTLLSEQEAVDLQQYFVDNKVQVGFGYPRSPVSVPGLYITVGDTSESDQFIGSDIPDDVEEEEPLQTPTGNLVEGTRFSTNVRIACRAPNSKLVVYLAAIAQWILIDQRLPMLDQGLQDQRISLRDVMPDNGLQPDLVLQRDLVLSCSHFATAITDIVNRIANVSVSVTPTVPSNPPPVVIRNSSVRGN